MWPLRTQSKGLRFYITGLATIKLSTGTKSRPAADWHLRWPSTSANSPKAVYSDTSCHCAFNAELHTGAGGQILAAGAIHTRLDVVEPRPNSAQHGPVEWTDVPGGRHRYPAPVSACFTSEPIAQSVSALRGLAHRRSRARHAAARAPRHQRSSGSYIEGSSVN